MRISKTNGKNLKEAIGPNRSKTSVICFLTTL